MKFANSLGLLLPFRVSIPMGYTAEDSSNIVGPQLITILVQKLTNMSL